MPRISKAEARKLYAEMTPKRAQLKARLDNIERFCRRTLTKGQAMPAELVSAIKAFVDFEVQYQLLHKYATDAVTYECSECSAIVLEKSASCPKCKARMSDDNVHGRPSGMGGGAVDNQHPSQRMNDQARQANFPNADAGLHPASGLLDAFDHSGNPTKPKRKSLTALHEESMSKRGRSNKPGRTAFLQ